MCLKVRDKSRVYSTCLEVVTNGVLLYSRYFAGAEQHSELVHIQCCFANFLRAQPLPKNTQEEYKKLHINVISCKNESNFHKNTADKTVCEHVLRADQVPVLQCMPCANTGPLQKSSLCRGPAVLQVGRWTAKVHIQLRGDAGLQIRSV